MRLPWTEERVEQLKKLWAEGLSASACARTLGGCTRNSCLSKIHRMGLAQRSADLKRTIQRRQPNAQANRIIRAAVTKETAAANAPAPLGPIGASAPSNCCQFIHGDPLARDADGNATFQMCGHPGFPWCAYHHGRVFPDAKRPAEAA